MTLPSVAGIAMWGTLGLGFTLSLDTFIMFQQMNREYCDPAGKFTALFVALTGLWSEISWASGVEAHLKLKLGWG